VTIDNLASGLIGAVVGGAIVVWAGQWRWRRENRAAARLLYYEVLNNGTILDALIKQPIAGFAARLSRGVWDAQGVRVASIVSGFELNRLGAAYLGVENLVSMRPLLGDQKWEAWIAEGDGKSMLTTTQDNFRRSAAILSRAINKKPWWPGPVVSGTGAWLGLGPAGRILLNP